MTNPRASNYKGAGTDLRGAFELLRIGVATLVVRASRALSLRPP